MDIDQAVPDNPVIAALHEKSKSSPKHKHVAAPGGQKAVGTGVWRCKSVSATAYGPPWGGIEGTGITATGLQLKPGKHVVAVDPEVIPLGSRMIIWPNPHHWSGEFVAADTGGAIRGAKIDFYVWQGPSAKDRWGVRQVQLCKT